METVALASVVAGAGLEFAGTRTEEKLNRAALREDIENIKLAATEEELVRIQDFNYATGQNIAAAFASGFDPGASGSFAATNQARVRRQVQDLQAVRFGAKQQITNKRIQEFASRRRQQFALGKFLVKGTGAFAKYKINQSATETPTPTT